MRVSMPLLSCQPRLAHLVRNLRKMSLWNWQTARLPSTTFGGSSQDARGARMLLRGWKGDTARPNRYDCYEWIRAACRGGPNEGAM